MVSDSVCFEIILHESFKQFRHVHSSTRSSAFQPKRTIETISEISVTISSKMPAREPERTLQSIHSGELTNIAAARILRGLSVYPAIVEAMFAATGKTDVHPDQVSASAHSCIRQRTAHMPFPRAGFHLLPRQKERSVLTTQLTAPVVAPSRKRCSV